MNDTITYLIGANKALAIVTVVIVQIVKMYLPPNPDAPIGDLRFSVGSRFKRYLLLAAFVIGVALSMILVPVSGAAWRDQLANGLQTGAYAVVTWEIYSNWVVGFLPSSRPK